MLIKQSSVFALLLAAFTFFFTKNTFSGDTIKREGKIVTYKGNKIEFNEAIVLRDTVMVEDPLTGEIAMRVTEKHPTPIKINGEQVYSTYTMRSGNSGGKRATESSFSKDGLAMYLLTNMEKEIKKLDDGEYHISIEHIIIDKKGVLVYFKLAPIEQIIKNGDKREQRPISKQLQDQFSKKISTLIADAPLFKPADVDGKPVYSTKDGMWNNFTVKNKKLLSL